MSTSEEPVIFDCAGDRLFGILHLPAKPRTRAVVIIVGGPQYRVGSHRQFLLLARFLADHGTPVLRFDYRGMGDSEGDTRSFEYIEDDLRAATDVLFDRVAGLRDVVFWGLCDAASAASIYAYQDGRVAGLVLVNPWVRLDASLEKVHLRHYYAKRIVDLDLWRDIFTGKINVISRLKDVIETISRVLKSSLKAIINSQIKVDDSWPREVHYTDRMYLGLERFTGHILFIISGNDLTAAEFCDMVSGSKDWRKLMKRSKIRRHDIREANHTFSRSAWRAEVENFTYEWLESW